MVLLSSWQRFTSSNDVVESVPLCIGLRRGVPRGARALSVDVTYFADENAILEERLSTLCVRAVAAENGEQGPDRGVARFQHPLHLIFAERTLRSNSLVLFVQKGEFGHPTRATIPPLGCGASLAASSRMPPDEARGSAIVGMPRLRLGTATPHLGSRRCVHDPSRAPVVGY